MDERSWIKRRIVELGGYVLLGLFVLLTLMLKLMNDAGRADANVMIFALICTGVLLLLSIVRAVLYYSLWEEDRPDYSFEWFRWRWKALIDFEEYREWIRERRRFALHPVTMLVVFAICFLIVLVGLLT